MQEVLAQITWYHNIAIFEKIKETEQRQWYIHKTIEHGWSRDILVLQIETHLYQRQGKGESNFSQTLPSPQSDLARQTLKDPYIFDFLMLEENAAERDIEKQLTYHITQFLLEPVHWDYLVSNKRQSVSGICSPGYKQADRRIRLSINESNPRRAKIQSAIHRGIGA